MSDARCLLVIGAGRGQIPAIMTAKRLGIRIVVVDRDPQAPGMQLADRAEPIDVVRVEEILVLAEAEGVDGVMTMQSDLPVPTVAAVAQGLGLPGLTRRAAQWCTNKIAMRERLAECSVEQPRFGVARTQSDVERLVRSIGLPAVIKSPESSGSRGVSVIRDFGDVTASYAAAMQFSPSGDVLVEEFISGVELGAQTLSLGDQCRVVVIHDDQMDEVAHVVPVGHSYPAQITEKLRKSIEFTVRSAVEALEVRDGPANVDIIVGGDGVPRIIEVGARIGATCLPELTTYHTGVDWVETAVRCALGGAPEISGTLSRPAAARVIISRQSGRLLAWRPPPHEYFNGIIDWEMETAEGETVRSFAKGPDRIGRVLASHSDVTIAIEIARRFAESVELKLEKSGVAS